LDQESECDEEEDGLNFFGECKRV